MKKLICIFFIVVLLCTSCEPPPPQIKPSDYDLIINDIVNNFPLTIVKLNIILENKLPKPHESKESDEKNPYYQRIEVNTELHDTTIRGASFHRVNIIQRSDGGFWMVINPSKDLCYSPKYLLEKYFKESPEYVWEHVDADRSYKVRHTYFEKHDNLDFSLSVKLNNPNCIAGIYLNNQTYISNTQWH